MCPCVFLYVCKRVYACILNVWSVCVGVLVQHADTIVASALQRRFSVVRRPAGANLLWLSLGAVALRLCIAGDV